MYDPIIEFFESVRLEEKRLGLGTPDIAATSEVMPDKNQNRAPSFGLLGGHRTSS